MESKLLKLGLSLGHCEYLYDTCIFVFYHDSSTVSQKDLERNFQLVIIL